MSTLKRLGDVSIHIHESHRTISCPFALGPLELKVEYCNHYHVAIASHYFSYFSSDFQDSGERAEEADQVGHRHDRPHARHDGPKDR